MDHEAKILIERQVIDDLRERVVRSEQNHSNLKENFQDFKLETQGEFNTLSAKIDKATDKIVEMGTSLGNEIATIKLTIAKWVGIGVALLAVAELALKFFFK